MNTEKVWHVKTMCECVDEIMGISFTDSKGIELHVVEFLDVTNTIDSTTHEARSNVTFSRVKTRQKGKKRITIKKLCHSFCPFCGLALIDEEDGG